MHEEIRKEAKNGDWLAFSGSLEKACLSPLFASNDKIPLSTLASSNGF